MKGNANSPGVCGQREERCLSVDYRPTRTKTQARVQDARTPLNRRVTVRCRAAKVVHTPAAKAEVLHRVHGLDMQAASDARCAADMETSS